MNPNPLRENAGQSMTWKDAAVVSTVLTVGGLFTVFMPLWGAASLQADLPKFCYELIMFTGGTFFTNIIGMLGLKKLVGSRTQNVGPVANNAHHVEVQRPSQAAFLDVQVDQRRLR